MVMKLARVIPDVSPCPKDPSGKLPKCRAWRRAAFGQVVHRAYDHFRKGAGLSG